MAAICVRNLDDRIMELLRVRAARHGRSREAEVRAILADAVRDLDEGTGRSQAVLPR
jgi:plasmid stability protein